MVDIHDNSRPIFRYAVISDTHIRPSGESSSPWKTNLQTNDRARWVAHTINAHNPDFVIHLGDIVHPVPHLPTYSSASKVAREIMGNITSPIYLVPGNHDVGDKDNPTVPSYIINDDFIDDFHRYHGPTFQRFDHGDIHFVIINSLALNSGLSEEAEQREWLEADLNEHRGSRIHVFSHYPPYLNLPDEPSNYDNLDQPARKWLLGLIEEHKVEAFFAGHVHQFFYKRHCETDIYNLLSTCNLRQDFANLFRVEAPEEYGRNDAAKLGYCIVDVNENGHVARIHRSYGRTLKEGETLHQETRIETYHPSEGLSAPLGVQLRYPIAEVTELPYMGPVDEFVRKKARNDYTALALWEAGIKTVRLPLADLTDETTRRRLHELHRMGSRYGFFTVNTPIPSLIAEHRYLVDFLEVIQPWETVLDTLTDTSKLRDTLNLPVYVSNIESSVHRVRTGPKFSHYMSYGFHIDDTSKLDPILPQRGSVDGFVFEVSQFDPLITTIQRISDYAKVNGFKALINIRLAPEDPANYPQDHHHTANRVAEAAVAGYAYPDVRIFLDTFMDHDRGYFPRAGLYDRRLNPRRAALVLRHLNSAINTYGTDINTPTKNSTNDWTTINFHSSQKSYCLHLPHTTDAQALQTEPTTVDLITGDINTLKLPEGSQYLIVKPQ
ncbi:MAG: metallophosphoesterase [Candidatus Bathyarchaeota archaeon]